MSLVQQCRPRVVASRVCALSAFVLVASVGCARAVEMVEEILDDRSAREKYAARLDAAGLATSAAVRDWRSTYARALSVAPRVASPHQEEGYFVPTRPSAVAYRVQVRRGQQLAFELQLRSDSVVQVFVEAWEVPSDSAAAPRRLAAADSGERAIVVRPRRDSDILLVAQPELLRGGRFTATVRVDPSLAFPVSGRGESDIGSRFGDSRDGGRRRHHGVDIFAPRGTPVIAADHGVVSRVSTSSLGGKVVWLRDAFGHSLYYAHLDSQHVFAGAQVRRGDTVGFVGNTGNARTTPPHLHFGVYRRGDGPVDPHWYVHRPRRTFARLTADTAALGAWLTVARPGAQLHDAPDRQAQARRPVPQHSAVAVVAAVGDWYRVALADGAEGYVVARDVRGVDRRRVSAPTALSPGSN